jgi:hypothetical protein
MLKLRTIGIHDSVLEGRQRIGRIRFAVSAKRSPAVVTAANRCRA